MILFRMKDADFRIVDAVFSEVLSPDDVVLSSK